MTKKNNKKKHPNKSNKLVPLHHHRSSPEFQSVKTQKDHSIR